MFRATNIGDTWEDLTGDLTVLDPGQLRSVVFVAGTPNKIFVGADRGVFVTSTASAGFWNRVSTTLPNALVMDMDYAAGTDTLYIGTMGRGAWSLAAASAIDLPPAARCRNVTVPADNMCRGTATPDQVDNASFDPEGLPVTLGPLSPAPPYPLGNTLVTLPVSSSGGNETCQATVTVADVTSPSITAPLGAHHHGVRERQHRDAHHQRQLRAGDRIQQRPGEVPAGHNHRHLDGAGPGRQLAHGNPAGHRGAGRRPLVLPDGDHHPRRQQQPEHACRGTSGSDCILGKGGDDILGGPVGERLHLRRRRQRPDHRRLRQRPDQRRRRATTSSTVRTATTSSTARAA